MAVQNRRAGERHTECERSEGKPQPWKRREKYRVTLPEIRHPFSVYVIAGIGPPLGPISILAPS